ncbi:hypothetical protein STEG23_031753 [Scotinomys teguina]
MRTLYPTTWWGPMDYSPCPASEHGCFSGDSIELLILASHLSPFRFTQKGKCHKWLVKTATCHIKCQKFKL